MNLYLDELIKALNEIFTDFYHTVAEEMPKFLYNDESENKK